MGFPKSFDTINLGIHLLEGFLGVGGGWGVRAPLLFGITCFLAITCKQMMSVLAENRQNLEILIEIFRQKLIVSNVIFAFLDHLKLKVLKPEIS